MEVVMADPITQRVGHMDPPVSLSQHIVCLFLGWLAGWLAAWLHFIYFDGWILFLYVYMYVTLKAILQAKGFRGRICSRSLWEPSSPPFFFTRT